MIRRLAIAIILLTPLASMAKTVQSVVLPTYGYVQKVGTTITINAPFVTYTDLTTDSTCASAPSPGFTWSSPTDAYNLSGGSITPSGSNATATWSSTYDPYNATLFPNGHQTAIGLIHVVCGGVSDTAQTLAESVTHPDTFYLYVTPWADFYQDAQSSALLQPFMVQGTTMTVGLGFATSPGGSGNPAQFTCNWSSSNNSIVTVDRHGLATGVAPGTATVTCTPAGNGVYGTSTCGTTFYGAAKCATGATAFWTFTVTNPSVTLQSWFVRTDGGTPWVSSGATPFGQCTGKTDAAYSGTTNARWRPSTVYTLGTVVTANNGHYQTVTTAGTSGTVGSAPEPTWGGTTTTDGSVTWTAGATYPVNQACGLGNFSFLYYDQVTANFDQWMISGTDIVLVHNPAGGFYANGYLTGNDVQNPNQTGTAGAIQPRNCGNPDCYMPTVPSGTAAHPTMILGENWASCSSDSLKTPILGSWTAKKAFNFHDSQNVIMACIKVSIPSQCANNGSFGSTACTKTASATTGNWAGQAIEISAMTANVSFNDIWIYGPAADCYAGASGVGISIVRNHLQGCPANGVNMDDSPYGGMSNISVSGGLTFTDTITEFAGCATEKPQVHQYPYIKCIDQNLGGTGDGFGTASTTGSWFFARNIWRYNMQDGLDMLHSNMQSLQVVNSQSYGNIGNPYKIGAADTLVLFQNNTSLSNCFRTDQVIGDEPASGVPTGALFCRGGGSPVINFSAYGTYLVQNNTLNGYGDTLLAYSCSAGSSNCSTATTALQNNAMLGFLDTSFTSQLAATFCMLDPSQTDCNHFPALYPANQGWATRSNNIYYNTRSCPLALTTAETCNTANPLFAGQPGTSTITHATEPILDGFQSPPPASTSSPLWHGGVSYAGLPSFDLFGTPTTTPPVMGAINIPGGTPTPGQKLKGKVVVSGKVTSP